MGPFFSINNPLLFSVITLLLLCGLIYIYYKYIIIPLNVRHVKEKENLELQNAKLMALFSELDPEPVFRFSADGRIISTNQSGQHLFKRSIQDGVPIEEVFPSLKGLNFSKCIEESATYHFTSGIEKNFYDITVKGVHDFGFGQIYCNDITIRKNIEEELRSSQRKLKELSKYIQIAQEREKQNLSRELHDNFGQILTTIKLNLEFIRNNSQTGMFDEIFGLLDKAMNEVRDLSYRLKPRILDDLGLIPSLKLLCNDVSSSTSIVNIFQVHDFDGRIKPELETCLYRIAQEALNNITKYSKAKEFSLQIFRQDNNIRMMIEDDGIGFDLVNFKHNGKEDKKEKMGLLNIQERALSYNGRCLIDSQIGAGTSIMVELPLDEHYE
jgi:signal transduction histidine kinase